MFEAAQLKRLFLHEQLLFPLGQRVEARLPLGLLSLRLKERRLGLGLLALLNCEMQIWAFGRDVDMTRGQKRDG
jgi:hypothetical protein